MKEKFKKILNDFEIYKTYNDNNNNMNEYYSWYDLKIYLVDDFVVIKSTNGLNLILDKTSYLKCFIEEYRYFQLEKENIIEKDIEKIYNLKSEQK